MDGSGGVGQSPLLQPFHPRLGLEAGPAVAPSLWGAVVCTGAALKHSAVAFRDMKGPRVVWMDACPPGSTDGFLNETIKEL